jgi:surface polysaccharide O-acyltransferase-like enzyme
MTLSLSRPAESVSAEPRRRHLDELDVVRGVTMAGVVAVHCLSFTTSGNSVPAGALTIMLHFTRESFFALMGFVLVFSALARPVSTLRFWRRRVPLVAIPYIAWSAIYVYWPGGGRFHPVSALRTLGIDLVEGTAWFHLYFLLVTLQIYLLFPLLLRFLEATRRHHVLVFAISLGLQLVATGVGQYGPQHRGEIGGWLWRYDSVLVISYQFFVIGGAIAGWHAHEILSCVRHHRRTLLIAVVAAAVVTQVWYFAQLAVGEVPGQAYAVFQPAEVVWSVAAVCGLALAGSWWAERREKGRHTLIVPVLSRHSFGMFLVHPLILYYLLHEGVVSTLRAHMPDLVAYLVVYPTVALPALAFAIVGSRTPLSLPLTGRPKVRRRRPSVTPVRRTSDPNP